MVLFFLAFFLGGSGTVSGSGSDSGSTAGLFEAQKNRINL
jgi:hypothetical protein